MGIGDWVGFAHKVYEADITPQAKWSARNAHNSPPELGGEAGEAGRGGLFKVA